MNSGKQITAEDWHSTPQLHPCFHPGYRFRI